MKRMKKVFYKGRALYFGFLTGGHYQTFGFWLYDNENGPRIDNEFSEIIFPPLKPQYGWFEDEDEGYIEECEAEYAAALEKWKKHDETTRLTARKDWDAIEKIIEEKSAPLEKVTEQDVIRANEIIRELGFGVTLAPEERDPDFYVDGIYYEQDTDFYGTLDEAKAFVDTHEFARVRAKNSLVIYDECGNAVAVRRWYKGKFKPGAADREEENGFFQGWFGFLGPWENIGQDEDFPTLAEVRKERERVRNSMLFT